MRLNQFLAHATGLSRRQADEAITAGRVRVNGKKAVLGQSVHTEKDEVVLDKKPCEVRRYTYIVFNKPKGLLTTRKDPEARETIYDVLPERFKDLKPAGRLDRKSAGLLILSDDGDFINLLIHPSHDWAKHYRVTLSAPLSDAMLASLERGVTLMPENKLACLTVMGVLAPNKLDVSTKTGYNRQIRRMFEAVGLEVKELKRLAVGPIELKGLAVGKFRLLTPTERAQVLKGAAQKSAQKSGGKQQKAALKKTVSKTSSKTSRKVAAKQAPVAVTQDKVKRSTRPIKSGAKPKFPSK